MPEKISWPQFAWAAGNVVAGLALGFFFVFRTLFTDSPQNLWGGEMLFAQFLNFVAYGVTIATWIRFGPSASATWLAGFVAPAAIVLALYWDPSMALRAMTFGFVALGTAAGWFGGLKWRQSGQSHVAGATD